MATAPCIGQEAEIESVVPAYSAAYVAVSNLVGIRDAMNESPLWQLVLPLDEASGKIKKSIGVDLRTFLNIFGSRIAFVQVYADISEPDLPVIVAEIDDSEGVASIIAKIEQTLNSNEEYEIHSPAGTYQGISFSSIRLVGVRPVIRYALLDGLMVIAFGQDTFESILDVYLGEDPSLLYDPKFNKTRAGISKDGEVFVYANMELLWPIIQSLWFRDSGVIFQIFGADSIKSIAWTTDLLKPNRNQQTYLYTGENRGLISLLFTEHGQLISPHTIPIASAEIFCAMNLGKPLAAWEGLGYAMQNLPDEENYAQMQNAISEFERETTLNLEGDILSLMTGEIGFAMPASGIMQISESLERSMEAGMLVFCGVQDIKQAAVSIDKVLLTAGVQLEQAEYNGKIIHYAPTSSDSITPKGYMFADKLLIFGNIQALRGIIEEAAPLVVSEKFAEINSQLPQRPGLMYYLDIAQMGQILLDPDMNQPEIDIAILQTLGSIGIAIVYDGEGLKSETASTSAEGWLKTLGILANLLVYSLP